MEAHRDYPTISIDQMQADKVASNLINEPQKYDVILTANSHGEIISDLAATLSGSLTIAPSYELDPTKVNPGIFEPIHGSFMQYAGKGIANPIGVLWAAAEMIKWLGDERAAEFLMNCVENVTQWGCRGRDIGGQSGTAEIANSILVEIDRMSSAS
jgi:isocitrate/isopropylmalate dehydrogenase